MLYSTLIHYRLFDVSFSCSHGEDQCECQDAKKRIERNEIVCDANNNDDNNNNNVTQCPEDCSICKFCMEQLGCL